MQDDKQLPKIDVINEIDNEDDKLIIKKNGVTLEYIGEKILDVSLHVVFIRDVTYSEFIDGKSQIMLPDGYRLISFNHDENLISNNYAVFDNIKPVKVKVYKTEDGKEFSPEFGNPLF